MGIKMGESLLQIIKRVGIFMICAQMLLHFKPSESYGKYIRLLMSMMVLAQLVTPIMGILGKGSDTSFGERVLFYDEILRQGMEEAEQTGTEAEALLEKMTLEEVKSRINAHNTGEATSADTVVEEIKTQNEIQTEAVEAESERLVERIEVKLYE